MSIDKARESFEANLRSVQELANFDRFVLNAGISNIQLLQDYFKERPSIADRIGNTLEGLRRIRENDSLRKHYSTIYNQCIVLLVSYFASTLHSIFIAAAPPRIGRFGSKDVGKEDLKFTLGELRDLDFELKDSIGQILTMKRDISFQDMQSTVKAFDGFLGIDVPAGSTMNNIILAQAARHVIVHSGSIVDIKCVKQLRDAAPRDVKPSIVVGELLAFTPGEVEAVASSMAAFVEQIVLSLDELAV